jgi:hypothetical protein
VIYWNWYESHKISTMTELKNHLENYYFNLVSKNKTGKFLQIKDDGIYTYMYVIGDDIQLGKDWYGDEFSEFFFDLVDL